MTSPDDQSGATAPGGTEPETRARHRPRRWCRRRTACASSSRCSSNTGAANVTTSFLWFALTFWVYLETRSVLATGIIGGAYMLLIAMFAMLFGTLVDRHRKHRVMVLSSVRDARRVPDRGRAVPRASRSRRSLDLGGPWFWLFSGIILLGAVVENMRNIALSTTVTLLVPVERHANANGLVGTVQGVAFMVTSVFSGLAIGLLGMGWTLAIAIVLTVAALVHLLLPPHPRGHARSDRREAPAHRPPRQRPRDRAPSRAVRADHLLDPQQPHRRRLHGAHGPVRTHAVPGRVVGRRPRHHGDRLHHRRRVRSRSSDSAAIPSARCCSSSS